MQLLLALGANLTSAWGKPAETLSIAIARLSERIDLSAKSSRFFSTPAYPLGSGPEFVNAVLALETRKTSRQLLKICHTVEAEAHRTRDFRWGPRTLDIDVLACGDQILPDLEGYHQWRSLPVVEQANATPTEMILPHPRLQDRAFVLVPMMDVAPDWVHPVLGLTTRQMVARLPRADIDAVTPRDSQ